MIDRLPGFDLIHDEGVIPRKNQPIFAGHRKTIGRLPPIVFADVLPGSV